MLVLVLSLIAFAIANSKGSGAQAIMDMVENAWGVFGAAFGPVILLSLFWKKLTFGGTVAGIAVGAGVDVLWLILAKSATGIYEIVPGFFAGLLAAWLVSALDKKGPGAQVETLFDEASKPGL